MKNISIRKVAEILANYTQIDELVDLAEAFKKGEIAIEGLDVSEVNYPSFPMSVEKACWILPVGAKTNRTAPIEDIEDLISFVRVKFPHKSRGEATEFTLSALMRRLMRRPFQPNDILILQDRGVVTASDLLWLKDHWPFSDRGPLEAALATALDIAINGPGS